MKGRIARYLSFRGYGFISVEGMEKDIFFHMSNYPPRELPRQGQWVEFEVNETPKGVEAIKIKLASEDEAEEQPVEEVAEAPEASVEAKTESDLDQLSGVGPKYQLLLEKSKVESCTDLASYTPEVLLTNLLSINDEESITKRPPTLVQVQDWIAQASQIAQ